MSDQLPADGAEPGRAAEYERARRQQLTAPEYREALILVLTELEGLDLGDRWGTAEHLGRLKVHIATAAGTVSPAMEPIYGLRALRRATGEVTPTETP